MENWVEKKFRAEVKKELERRREQLTDQTALWTVIERLRLCGAQTENGHK